VPCRQTGKPVLLVI